MAETVQLTGKHLAAIQSATDTASLMDDVTQFFHQRRADIEQSAAYTEARTEFDAHYEKLETRLAGDRALLLAIESNVWEIVAACEESAYQQGFKDAINLLMQFVPDGGIPTTNKEATNERTISTMG